MNRPPHPPDESVLARGLGWYMLLVGPLMGLVALLPEFIGSSSAMHLDFGVWRTMVFTTLCLAQLGNALAIRSDRFLLVELGIFSNRPLVWAVLATLLLQVAVVYMPFLQGIFATQALTLGQFLLSLALSSIVFITVELSKLLRRWRERKAAAAA